MKKWIYVIIGVVLLTVIHTLWKSGWFDQKSQDVSADQYLLVDSLGNYSINLPTKPTIKIDSKSVGDHVKVSIEQYTSIAPSDNKILFSIMITSCDTCTSEFKNEIALKLLQEALNAKDLSLNEGTDFKVNHYNGLLFKTHIDNVLVHYFACVVGDHAYLYAQTFGGIDPEVGDIYLKTLTIK